MKNSQRLDADLNQQHQIASVAEWIRRPPLNRFNAGSNPAGRTVYIKLYMVYVAQLVRASDCGSEGCGIVPHRTPDLQFLKPVVTRHQAPFLHPIGR